MKIQKIEKLNYARFHNFSWKSGLDSFCDGVNILFGWNGSGKTTYSKVFWTIERDTIEDGCTFKFKTDVEQLIESSDLSDLKNKLRVFNDEYVEETLSGSSKIPYIFFTGKEAVDYAKDEKKLEDKNEELAKLKLPEKHEDIAKQTAFLIKSVTGINSYIKELTGGSTYASYDKTDFENRIKNIDEKIKNKGLKSHADLIREDIDTLKTQLVNSERLTKIDEDIATSARWLIDNIDGINIVLQSEPVQKQSERIESLNESETGWIKEGVALHFNAESKCDVCLFCSSKITNSDELLKHFSEAVVHAIDAVDGFSKKIETYTTGLAKIASPTKSQKTKIDLLCSTFDKLTSVLREKRNAVSNKKNEIALDIAKIETLTITSPIDATTTAYAIESHYVAEKYNDYGVAHTEYKKVEESQRVLEAEIKELDKQVRALKQKAKSTHEPALALNRLFKVVFPYRDIEIADGDDGTGYVLKRDGEFCAFSSLSKGEKNFIALAYFIYSINDVQNQLPDDGVVIVDDPVSSLDKQAIFQIFSIIVNEIKKHGSRQYFLLTHNLDFLGHLKEHLRKGINSDGVRLFSFAATKDGCIIEEMPLLLKNHRSDYYYVFSVLYGFKDRCDMENAHLVVNLLRRWLETFLEFKFSTSGDLQSTLESACAEARKLTEKWEAPFGANYLEIYRFINHGSHGFPDTESIDDSILSNAHQRIQEAFQLVKILDPLHYKKLEAIIT